MSSKLTTKDFIASSLITHGLRYSYDKVEYIDAGTKVEIYCTICESYFKQIPYEHKSGKGCKKCSTKQIAQLKLQKTKDALLSKFIKTHGTEKFSYNNVVYKGANIKVDILCNTCSNTFKQIPRTHTNGAGCPICAGSSNSHVKKHFSERMEKQYKGLYDYSNTEYINTNTRVDILCKKCKTTFSVSPDKHKQGQGCPCYIHFGFNRTKPAILYYFKIEFNTKWLYKVGITNRSLTERYNPYDRSRMVVLAETNYNIGQLAYNEEQRVIKEYAEFKYTGPTPFSGRTGITEVFTKDILRKNVH